MSGWFKVQFGLFAIFVYQVVLNVLPGSAARALWLRMVGNAVGANVGLHSWLRLTWPTRMEIGENSTINFGVFLDSRGGIRVGANTMIGHKCSVYSATHDLDSGEFETVKKPVLIGSNVVIFPHSLVMPGTVIADGAVILPGSVVSGQVGANQIFGGVPAKYIRDRNPVQMYKLDYTFWFPNS
ncbi:maltose O-acetyltransferase [Pelomonas aquatica]|uniref:Maltose O-acetyltransferase n=1 Tax=Pelomonas aquatica TaxID=431058 RepID=A0ABU1Z540_9BURK|nr:acyltransferase [Pelomonas aquatica]MDR7295729.1 maltose O-acetyltransferase [Pelomonas aquatica]